MLITIDGPTGTGKTTIAKEVARRLGFIYFDTGAMYRCVTLGVIRKKIDLNDENALVHFLSTFSFEIKRIQNDLHYFIGEEEVSDEIRQREVTSFVSAVSAHPAVRAKLVQIQRQCAEKGDAVFEGRDMGSVVFPEAPYQFFLTATPQIRAERRYNELKQKYPKENLHLTLEEVLESLIKRDAYDSSRHHSPLRKSDNSIVIDTSDLTIEQVVDLILRQIIHKS